MWNNIDDIFVPRAVRQSEVSQARINLSQNLVCQLIEIRPLNLDGMAWILRLTHVEKVVIFSSDKLGEIKHHCDAFMGKSLIKQQFQSLLRKLLYVDKIIIPA